MHAKVEVKADKVEYGIMLNCIFVKGKGKEKEKGKDIIEIK